MPPHPTMIPVTSSNLHSVGRCDDGHLWVCFKGRDGGPGKTYRYDGAAEAHHGPLMAASSPGQYFGSLIRKQVPGVHVSG